MLGRHKTVMFKNLRMGRRGFGHAFSCAICKNLYFYKVLIK